MTHSRKARGAEPGTPTSDKADAANVGQVGEQSRSESPDSHGAPLAGQALQVIDGEGYAHAYMLRAAAGTAQPGELAVILSFLTDEMLHGACRVIEKALGAKHG